MGKKKPQVPEGFRVVYATRITLRTGRVLYARDFGLRAFRFLVRDKR